MFSTFGRDCWGDPTPVPQAVNARRCRSPGSGGMAWGLRAKRLLGVCHLDRLDRPAHQKRYDATAGLDSVAGLRVVLDGEQ